MFEKYGDILSPKEAAEALRISLNSMYKLLHEQQIGFKRLSRKYIIPKKCLVDYVQSARYSVSDQ